MVVFFLTSKVASFTALTLETFPIGLKAEVAPDGEGVELGCLFRYGTYIRMVLCEYICSGRGTPKLEI